MENTRLTKAQLRFLDTFGYLHFPGLLHDCIDRIQMEFEAVWQRRGGGHNGAPHEGTARSCIVPFIDQSEYLSGLLDDPRIEGIVASILGDDYNYLGSDGNYYVGDTTWHSDGAWPRPVVYYKLALYLDRLTRETGALRVIPGSHRYGDQFAETLQQGARDPMSAWGVSGDLIPAVALETRPGDVVIFHQGTKHSSWGGGTYRRMFTINYAPRHTPEQIPLLQEEISAFARFWIDSVYGEAMLRSAGPSRRVHLEQALAHQYHLPELTRQARARMKEPSRG
jgi:hypothetical protein